MADADIRKQRLAAVRAALETHGADALLVTSSDPHLSEYLPRRWQGRAWLSGFTGSMGTLAVTADKAVLIVDSRYWLDAPREIDGTGIEMMKLRRGGPTVDDWLSEAVSAGGTVMTDGDAISVFAATALQARLNKTGVALRTDTDLLESLWSDRPAMPDTPIFRYEMPYAVRSRADKLASIREAMQAAGATHFFISALDEIAWTTNLRGSDIDFNPYFLSHLLIDALGATLFVNRAKVAAAIATELAGDGIKLAPYETARSALAALPAHSRLLIDPKALAWNFRGNVPQPVSLIEQQSLVMLIKARKTPEEIAFFRDAMVEDGLAFCRFYSAFEASMARGDAWSEYRIHEELTAARALSSLFITPSFSTSAGYNANGASPHYTPTPDHQVPISGDGLLVVDSGGQFLGGTTDICRVWAIGRTSVEMRRDVTLTLKALIALSRARFPLSTPAPMLDAIARAPLWEHSINYNHGTGHGIGCFLGVHEGPHYLSGPCGPNMELHPGMLTAIEPGVYRTGQWGSRLENIAAVVEAPDAGFGAFLTFETLTLCPIDTRCLEPELLEPVEIAWLDSYHAMIRDRLADRLDGPALAWLIERTAPLAGATP